MQIVNLQANSPAQILMEMIEQATTHGQLTVCACHIHQVCPSQSDAEKSLILRVATRQVELEMLEISTKNKIQDVRLEIVRRWSEN